MPETSVCKNMNAVVDIKTEMKEKVANLVHLEVPVEQIARVCSCEVAQINALLEDEEFKVILASKTIDTIEENKQFNDGWDAAEARALKVINTTLETTMDPDFALRAAAVSNKAIRRGSLGRAINGNNVTTAVINLTQTFVNRLEHFANDGATVINHGAPKQHDSLEPSQVEKMFVINRAATTLNEIDENKNG